MKRLKIGTDFMHRSAEEIKKYLKKNYILQHLTQHEYIVMYDKTYNGNPYRLIENRKNNTSIQNSTLEHNNWTIIKVPKALISFKEVICRN